MYNTTDIAEDIFNKIPKQQIIVEEYQKYSSDYNMLYVYGSLISGNKSIISNYIEYCIECYFKNILENTICINMGYNRCPALNKYLSQSWYCRYSLSYPYCPYYAYCNKHQIKKILEEKVNTYLKTIANSVRHRCFYRFYPVGQGLMCAIYICRYNYNRSDVLNNKFRNEYKLSDGHLMIYDCGSGIRLTSLKEEMKRSLILLEEDCKRFKVRKKSDKYVIDNIVISHMDSDHINGVKTLNDDYLVKNIIYPFCSILELMSDALRSSYSNDGSQELFEPKEYLMSNLNVENIIEVHPGKDLDYGVMSRLSDYTGVEGVAGTLVYNPADEANYSNGISNFYKAYMPGVSNNSRISANYDDGIWMQQLISCVPLDNTYNEAYERVRISLLKDKINIEMYGPEQLIELICNKEDRKKFVKALSEVGYYNAGSIKNASSLCFYFGPKKSIKEPEEAFTNKEGYINGSKIKEVSKSLKQRGVLLTGDTELTYQYRSDPKVSHAQVLVEEMNATKACPGAILLPHHGSKDNINEDSFDVLCEGTGAKTWVVSFGKDNRYGHPHDAPCRYFGKNIFPIKQKKGSDHNSNCFQPDNEFIHINKPLDPSLSSSPNQILNDIILIHCHGECCVLLDSYSVL